MTLLLTIERLLVIKGAPDVLIGRCSKYTSIEGDAKVLDPETLAKIEDIKNIWSSQGRRVILLARKTICREQIRELVTSGNFEDEVMHHTRTGLTLVGIVGIVDPPRDEIPSVVSTLRGAGIRIFMVTGGKYMRNFLGSTEPASQASMASLNYYFPFADLFSCRLCPHCTSHCD